MENAKITTPSMETDFAMWRRNAKPKDLPALEEWIAALVGGFAPDVARTKASYIGAPAVFALEMACRDVCDAFGSYGCYVVGSSLDRPDWRDVDLRLIMSDDDFAALFPNAGEHWEHDARWLLLTVSISAHLSKVTGLPIDFQFQPQTHANARHKGKRNAIGMRIGKRPDCSAQTAEALQP